MKILVNATTTVIGGGVQVSASFITQAARDPMGHEFMFMVCPMVMQNLDEGVRKAVRISVITPSPARIWSGRRSRQRMREIEAAFGPDVAFTVFGPAYFSFRAPHVCGFADPWVTHRSLVALRSLSAYQRCYTPALCLYKQLRLSVGDYYWVEANSAKQGLMRILGIDSSRIRVIANTHADLFRGGAEPCREEAADGMVYVFCLAAPYPHKNLGIIPEVARLLKDGTDGKGYRFIVTLPDEGEEVRKFWAKARRYDVTDMIENAGRLRLEECPGWYARSDIVFMPTLLEVFSATYPEAMAMGRPIVTTDLDFAHDICADAAVYYSPQDPRDAAERIKRVTHDKALRESLIRKGRERVATFPRINEKYRLTMQWITEAARHGSGS